MNAFRDKPFFVKSVLPKKLIRIKPEEITYVESALNYIVINLADKNKYMCHMTLKGIEQVLEKLNGFLRVHRSFIINMNKVKAIDFPYLILENDIKILIGISYRRQFLKEIETLIVK